MNDGARCCFLYPYIYIAYLCISIHSGYTRIDFSFNIILYSTVLYLSYSNNRIASCAMRSVVCSSVSGSCRPSWTCAAARRRPKWWRLSLRRRRARRAAATRSPSRSLLKSTQRWWRLSPRPRHRWATRLVVRATRLVVHRRWRRRPSRRPYRLVETMWLSSMTVEHFVCTRNAPALMICDEFSFLNSYVF